MKYCESSVSVGKSSFEFQFFFVLREREEKEKEKDCRKRMMWFKKKRDKDSKIMKQIRKQRFVVLSPLTLGFAALTVLGFALPVSVFGATSSISPGIITHTLIHSSFDHWFNNISFILLLMPSCEDHFGMAKLFKMICVVAFMSCTI